MVVFLGTYTTLVQSCMSFGSLTLSQSTPCRLSVYAIGPKLCKYYSNLPIGRLNKHIDIEPMVILVHRLQRWPNIIPPLVQCLVFAWDLLRRKGCCKCDFKMA